MNMKFLANHALIILIPVFLFSAVISSGQNKIRQLTLAEAIEISKAQSPDALNAKQTFSKSY